MNKDNITKGKFTVSHLLDEQYKVWDSKTHYSVGGFHYKEIGKANAELIAETFNVFTETNKTPRELMDANKELLEALKVANDWVKFAGDVSIVGKEDKETSNQIYLHFKSLIKKHSNK